MLGPEVRTVAMDALRPPPDHRLDRAVLATYSLDLDVLLALPLALLAHTDRSLDELLEQPLLLMEALREAGDRLRVFVDEAGIAAPRSGRPLYSMLERSVVPVRAPNGGVFHPKVWVVRFLDEAGDPLIRVLIGSRNLTFDRSWDVALTSEGCPAARRSATGSRALADLLRALPTLAVADGAAHFDALAKLAAEVERTEFPAPDGFDGPLATHAFGLGEPTGTLWRAKPGVTRLLAMSPFVHPDALGSLAGACTGERTLISRREALDALSEQALSGWTRALVLSDGATAGIQDESSPRTSDLHAKIAILEYGRRVRWLLGSANFTAAALGGRNVELIALVDGARGNAGSGRGVGIERFLESGFHRICEPYRRDETAVEDKVAATARRQLEHTRRALVEAGLTMRCRCDENEWTLCLEGTFAPPHGVTVVAWPASLDEGRARGLGLPLRWSLPMTRLTAFIAFRLASEANVDDLRLVLKLPVDGMPDGRAGQILRSLIDSPARFLQFLRALLGGLEGFGGFLANGVGAHGDPSWAFELAADTLLEDLLRVASRDPARLDAVRRLIEDLRDAEAEFAVVPEDFRAIWDVVDAALGRGPDNTGRSTG